MGLSPLGDAAGFEDGGAAGFAVVAGERERGFRVECWFEVVAAEAAGGEVVDGGPEWLEWCHRRGLVDVGLDADFAEPLAGLLVALQHARVVVLGLVLEGG